MIMSGLGLIYIATSEVLRRYDLRQSNPHSDGGKWKNELAVLFDIHRIPTMILVDRNGKVRYVDPPAAALPRLVGQLLSEQ